MKPDCCQSPQADISGQMFFGPETEKILLAVAEVRESRRVWSMTKRVEKWFKGSIQFQEPLMA